MKKFMIFPIMLLLALTMTACDNDSPQIDTPDTQQPDGNNENNTENNSLMINIITGNGTVTATMEDNVAARDFISRLPLEVTLNDYSNTEKIFYPSPALTTEGAPRGCTPVPGDITIYRPWGNVAIFYKSFSRSSELIKIGHIDGTGINALSIPGNVHVRFELKTE